MIYKQVIYNFNFMTPFYEWGLINCLKVTEPLRGDSLLFTTKFPEFPGSHIQTKIPH